MGCDGNNNVKDRDQKIEPIKENIEIKDQPKEEKNEPIQKKPGGRRSSLKMHNPRNKMEPQNLVVSLKGNKRHSVSFGQSNTFQFKAMKAMFQESHDVENSKKINDEEH